ncbi:MULTISPECIES: sarcosine oxidase subunit delta [unclassified Chelatococcus]|jgi:heterotetrameric sarcosine oxidase delta subunit|uniref:sarcosine oxidase subunit delta n=1 Tax=unclassified Chelatococcus TaxID=2638111 RepID=UPI001BCBCFE5|nr:MULTISPECIES: sarcosine oxidase subunit delta [unclassified Chelatococcus]CAH1655447.1 Sarcosine oxidase subunit delta [Hyphomicrobiales bacterium]MBS7742609.1 sarcosine oxidase subunit delta [Chelatococcus sp. HY11]MBX3542273.1 sarcosine oxidase subunit delta [Chelatococcus sp.]MCO5075509.1 sarcosine oxidase subunit delta [Chelatococcus sp.]CAH1695487.1 Sarcosine oxidase subunit delta [Hyphomicrobiales bacterium]
MRIPCPFCGERGVSEFSYRGDATLQRPDAGSENALAAFVDYVHLRDNPAGRHREFWQHTGGCRAWLVVVRDVRTHAIEQVSAARGLSQTVDVQMVEV